MTEYDNSSVGEEEHFEMRHLISAVTDWQIWLHILIYMSIIGPGECVCVQIPSQADKLINVLNDSVWNFSLPSVGNV